MRQTTQCSVCETILPLRDVRAGEAAQRWSCTVCGAVYSGVLREDASEALRKNVRREDEPAEPAASSLMAMVPPPPPRLPAAAPRPAVACQLHSAVTRALDATLNGVDGIVAASADPFSRRVTRRSTPPLPETQARFADALDNSAAALERVFGLLRKGRAPNDDSIGMISREALECVAEDMDLFVAMGLRPGGDDYPSRHSLHVAMLAIAIGVAVGYDEPALLMLAQGCLLHDLGMLGVEEAAYQHERELSPEEYSEVAAHPVRVFEFLQRYGQHIATPARLVAYQIHERCDGSGYPRGAAGKRIHPLAKIAAVADVFVALISPRPHRRPLAPYNAMEKILFDTRLGLFDAAAVRGLLRTVSLYPLGSEVELSDGRTGLVCRAHPEHYDRPMLVVTDGLLGQAVVVDLLRHPDLKVLRVKASSGPHQPAEVAAAR